MPETKTVGAVERSIKILEELEELEGARISELSEQLEMAESSIHSHLATLDNAGYVVNQGGVYDISINTLRLSRYAKRRNPIFQSAKEAVERLATETDEVASLFAEDHGIGRFIHCRKSPQSSQPSSEGKKAKLHTVAPGKSLLAFYPDETVERILTDHGLTKRTEETITEKEALYAELEDIRTTGVAFNHGEFIEGLRAVGVPVKGASGQAVAALSVYGPEYRMSGTFFHDEVPALLKECANDIHLENRFGDE